MRTSEQKKQYYRDWVRNNIEHVRAYARAKYHRRRHLIIAQKRAWRQAHPEEARKIQRNRYKRLKQQMIAAYGGVCVCCGESEYEFLTIDHIGGGGKEHREKVGYGSNMWRELRRRGWPKNEYRLMCMQCNWAIRGGKTCPHERRRLEQCAS